MPPVGPTTGTRLRRLRAVTLGGGRGLWQRRGTEIEAAVWAALNTIRTGLLVVITLVVVFGAAVLAAPFLLASDTVKSGIATRLAAMTGATVQLSGTPSVGLSPYLSVTYRNVLVSAPTPDREPLATIEQATIKFAFWPALSGTAMIEEIALVRPRIIVPATGMAGVADEIWQHAVVDELSPTRALSISVRDGTIEPALAPTDMDERLTGLTGRVGLPSRGVGGSFAMDGVWHGQAVRLAGSIGVAGRDGRKPVELTVSSAPFDLALSGKADATTAFSYEGNVALETPSLQHAALWLGLPDGSATPAVPITIRGAMVWAGTTARIRDVALTSGNLSATGRLDLATREGKLAIDGTVAMTGLSLEEGDTGPRLAFARLAQQQTATLDLRLSAPIVRYRHWNFANVAGGVRIVDGKTLVDIGSAESAGGGVAGQVAYEADGSRRANLDFSNVDLQAFAQDLPTLPFNATGTGDLRLNTVQEPPGLDTRATFALLARDGVLNGPAIGQTAMDDLMPAIGSGTIPFDRFEIEGDMQDRTVRIDKAELANPDLQILLTGRIDVADALIALQGTVVQTALPLKRVPFVLQGTLDAPRLTPVTAGSVDLGAARAGPLR